MSSALIVENNDHLESLYALNLRLYVGIEKCEVKKKAAYALKYLQEEKPPSVIICRLQIGQEKTADMLYQEIQKPSINIPLVVVGAPSTALSGKPDVYFVPMGFNIKPLLRITATILGVTAQSMAEKEVEDYFPIPVNYFKSIKNCVCDVYASDIKNEGQYLKLFSKENEIPEGAVKSLVSQGNTYLFVNKYDRLKFTNNVTYIITGSLNLDTLDDTDQLYVSELASNQLANQIRTLGITEETSKMAKKNMQMVEKDAKRNTSLASLMKKLMSNQASYLFKHVQILTYVTHQMMQHMDWANEEQEKTLAFMAYFHDITLETDQQAMIHSKKELELACLPEEEAELVNSHSQKSADLVVTLKEAPHGIGSLIRQHHGVLNGYGFTETYGGNISPLSILFIVAEEYTRNILQFGQDEKINLDVVMLEMGRTFKSHRFAKILAALEKIIIHDE